MYEKSKFILKNKFLKLDNWNRYNFLYFVFIKISIQNSVHKSIRIFVYSNNFIFTDIICIAYCFYFLLILNKLND